MKPAAFSYHRPESPDEVDALLDRYGDEAKLLAGGQSLVPILNMRLAAPEHVVDLNHLAEIDTEPVRRDGAIVCGPLVRHVSVEESTLVHDQVPLLARAITFVGHPAIRSRGTVAGSIAHADPAAELPAVLVGLAGEVAARSRRGSRTIPAKDFFVGALENSLAVDEWVTEVRWPPRAEGSGFAFEEFARRSGDYALCGVAAVADRGDGADRVVLTYFGMGDLPARIEAEVGDRTHVGDMVSELVDGHLDPPADVHADRAYRLHLGRRLGTRAALRALDSVAECQ
jgi:carbon-monoxide dehydrogenase medium subunit